MSKKRPPHHSLTEPRPWFDIFWGKRGWLAILAAVATIIATIVAGLSYRTATEFDRTGLWTEATVISKRISSDDDGDTYFLKFQFAAQGRGTQDVEHSVSRTEYRKTQTGTTRPIRYLPARPWKTELNEGDTRRKGYIVQGVALAAGIFGLGTLWFVGSATNRAVKARRHGQLQLATVTGFHEYQDSGKGTGKGYMIWKLDDGSRGESQTHDIRWLRRIGTGAKINVYVRGGESVWEGDVGPRAERRSAFPKVPRDPG